jgi:hypothetical protein
VIKILPGAEVVQLQTLSIILKITEYPTKADTSTLEQRKNVKEFLKIDHLL